MIMENTDRGWTREGMKIIAINAQNRRDNTKEKEGMKTMKQEKERKPTTI